MFYDIGEASRNGLMVEKLLWEFEAVWTFLSVSYISLMVLKVLDDDKYFNHDVAMMILNLFSTVITPSATWFKSMMMNQFCVTFARSSWWSITFVSFLREIHDAEALMCHFCERLMTWLRPAITPASTVCSTTLMMMMMEQREKGTGL